MFKTFSFVFLTLIGYLSIFKLIRLYLLLILFPFSSSVFSICNEEFFTLSFCKLLILSYYESIDCFYVWNFSYLLFIRILLLLNYWWLFIDIFSYFFSFSFYIVEFFIFVPSIYLSNILNILLKIFWPYLL